MMEHIEAPDDAAEENAEGRRSHIGLERPGGPCSAMAATPIQSGRNVDWPLSGLLARKSLLPDDEIGHDDRQLVEQLWTCLTNKLGAEHKKQTAARVDGDLLLVADNDYCSTVEHNTVEGNNC